MSNRRDFILKSAAASGALALMRSRIAFADTAAAKPLRILLLGGAGFIGSHLIRVALARGHKVSVQVWTGEKRPVDLPPEVERLPGDRNGDLESIKNRDWDAVVDIATYGPLWVRTLGEAIKDRVKHYTFISSVAVYDNTGVDDNGTRENNKLLEYRDATDPYSVTHGSYGPFKVLCEREADRQFPGKTLIVRPTVIVGPNDGGGAFTYLCARMDAGGEMLVAGDPLQQMQLIDVRDMVAWMIPMIERGETGPFNAAGPAQPMGWAEMLGAIRGPLAAPVKLTWVPLSWFTERKVSPNTNLLFWPTGNGFPGLLGMNNDKARATGLTFRPTSVSAADTLAWYKSLPPDRQAHATWRFDKEHTSLQDFMVLEREFLQQWHARKPG